MTNFVEIEWMEPLGNREVYNEAWHNALELDHFDEPQFIRGWNAALSLNNKIVPQDRLEAIAQDNLCDFPECTTHEPKIGICVACDAIYAAREAIKLRAEIARLKGGKSD